MLCWWIWICYDYSKPFLLKSVVSLLMTRTMRSFGSWLTRLLFYFRGFSDFQWHFFLTVGVDVVRCGLSCEAVLLFLLFLSLSPRDDPLCLPPLIFTDFSFIFLTWILNYFRPFFDLPKFLIKRSYSTFHTSYCGCIHFIYNLRRLWD